MEVIKNETELKPIWDSNYSAIVMSCSNEFVPYLCVCLQSIVEHTSSEYNYDFIIFEKSISEKNKQIIKKNYESDNISIRFTDPSKYFDLSKLHTYVHVSVETYFKLAIPIILKNYDKVLFLDADIIVEKDLANLYSIDLEGKSLGAAMCCMWNGYINLDQNLYSRTTKTLKITDVHKFIQGGVLLIDINKWNINNYPEKLIEKVTKNKYITADQGALNEILYGDIKIIDSKWNHEALLSEYKDAYKHMDNYIRGIYDTAKAEPYIVHYNGYMKPWEYLDEYRADLWWSYAYKTPFYTSVLVEKESSQRVLPKFENYKNVIAMSSSDLYAPYLSVYLLSILNNADDNKFYDIVVLETDITEEHKEMLLNLVNKENVSLRFQNVSKIFDNLDLYISYDCFAKQCYYRLALGKVFSKYDKVIYTDIDITANGDISQLFDIDLGDKIIGACEEVLWNKEHRVGRVQLGINIEKYIDELCGKDALYYNTGVVVVDVKKFNEFITFEELIKIALNNKYINIEQCVLNKVFNRYFYNLPNIYNFEVFFEIFDGKTQSFKDYMKTLNNAVLLHHLTMAKAWFYPEVLKGYLWWKYARQSPFYELILARMMDNKLSVSNGILSSTLNNNLLTYFQTIMYNMGHYPKNIFNYYKYKLLRNFVFGKTLDRYIYKKHLYKDKIKSVEHFINGK